MTFTASKWLWSAEFSFRQPMRASQEAYIGLPNIIKIRNNIQKLSRETLIQSKNNLHWKTGD